MIWKYPNAVKYDVIKANDELEVELKTEEIQEDKVSIQFDLGATTNMEKNINIMYIHL